jgi:hypothetical protein
MRVSGYSSFIRSSQLGGHIISPANLFSSGWIDRPLLAAQLPSGALQILPAPFFLIAVAPAELPRSLVDRDGVLALQSLIADASC